MISRTVRLASRKLLIVLAIAMLSVSARAGQWTALGPDGGDVCARLARMEHGWVNEIKLLHLDVFRSLMRPSGQLRLIIG